MTYETQKPYKFWHIIIPSAPKGIVFLLSPLPTVPPSLTGHLAVPYAWQAHPFQKVLAPTSPCTWNPLSPHTQSSDSLTAFYLWSHGPSLLISNPQLQNSASHPLTLHTPSSCSILLWFYTPWSSSLSDIPRYDIPACEAFGLLSIITSWKVSPHAQGCLFPY